MENRRAAISINMIIMVILLVFSVAVILFFWSQFDWKSDIDKEACHTSVVLRHSSNIKGSVQALPIPLKCKTEKICFTSGLFQNCDNQFAGEKYEKINIGGDETKLKEELSKLSYECWDMLGRGLLEYHPRVWGWDKNYCSPCSRIAFSDELHASVPSISYKELYKHMAENKVPNPDLDMSYLRFLYGIEDYPAVNVQLDDMEDRVQRGGGRIEDIDLGKQHVVMVMMNKEGWGGTILGGVVGGIAAITVISLTGGTAAIPIFLVGSGGGARIASAFTSDAVFSPPTIMPYEAEYLQKLDCGEIDFVS